MNKAYCSEGMAHLYEVSGYNLHADDETITLDMFCPVCGVNHYIVAKLQEA